MPVIKNASDVTRLEQAGLDAWLPAESMYDLLAQAAERHGERKAITFISDATEPGSARSLTYAQLFARVTRAANLFHRLGVTEDQSVALIAPNMPEAQIAMWAAETVARVTPVNVLLDPDHVTQLVKAANARVLVALGPDPDLPVWPQVERLAETLDLDAVLVIGDNVPDRPDVIDFDEAVSREDATLGRDVRVPNRASPAALFHTGGTTGLPKLAQHTHGNQLHTSKSGALYYDLTHDDVMFNGFPIFHVAGSLVYGSACFVAGAELLLPTRTAMRNPDVIARFWDLVAGFGVTVVSGVPTTLATILGLPREDGQLDRVRLFLSGGSPLPAELASAAEQAFDRPVRNIFGMTESAGLVAVEPCHAPRTGGSAGLPLPFTEVSAFAFANGVVDLGAPCSPGETGVLALRGPNVSPGYTDASRNSGTFESGWLISGDLGHTDAAGRVFITGRAKDVIIRGAHNIDPAVIEEAVAGHPAVEMCAAVGQADSYAGEVPVCFVTLKAGQRAAPEDIAAHAAPLIPEPPARPRRIIVIDEMPVTAVGKIYKPGLRQLAATDAFEATLTGALGDAARFDVTATDNGGQIAMHVRLGDAADDGRARQALRDYALPWTVTTGLA